MKAEFICVNLRNLWTSSTSLLFHHWHLSSRVVTLLTFLLVVVVNLPGNVSRHVAEVHGMGNFVLAPQYEHGWPMTHIVRQEGWTLNWFGFKFADPTVTKCWRFWDLNEQDEFHTGRLMGNIALGLTMTLLTGCLFEAWRRRHRILFQVHLLDVGLLITALAGLLGWYVEARTAHGREAAALSVYADEMTKRYGAWGNKVFDVDREQRGPTWLRLWIGDKYFEVLDRVIAAEPLMEQQMPKMAAFRELRKARFAHRDLHELAQLRQFPQLEELDLSLRIRIEPTNGSTIRLPPMRNLRVLTIRSVENQATGLDQLQNLRVLNLHDSFMSTETLEEISRLKKLKQLSLTYSYFPAQAIKHLRLLAELEELDLDQTTLNDEAVTWLAELPALKKLSIRIARISDASLSSISKSGSLESLDLDSLTEAGLQTLTNSPRLCLIRVTTPDTTLCQQKNAHGWKIVGSLGEDNWIFARPRTPLAKEAADSEP